MHQQRHRPTQRKRLFRMVLAGPGPLFTLAGLWSSQALGLLPRFNWHSDAVKRLDELPQVAYGDI